MMMKGSIRCFSTRTIVDRLFNIAQLSPQLETSIQLTQFIKTYLQQEETVSSNLVNDVIRRWAIEQPTKLALWTCEVDKDEHEKLTFNDLYTQSSRLANVLTGEEFNLTPGKTILVMLPYSTPERVLLQLACAQSGLVFCSHDPKDLSHVGIVQRIEKLAVDCIITNEDNLEFVRRHTYNPLRPLKKGLITKSSSSQPLPVGWNHLMQRTADAESEYTKPSALRSHTPALRLLSNNNQVIQYSQKHLNLHLLITALWLNMEKTSRLVWMKNQNEIISIAPWLFGTSIFLKETGNLQTMLETLEKQPIDTLCASASNYRLLNNQPLAKSTHLTQLFSTEPVDSSCRERWHSLTNRHIRDDYEEFNDQSVFESSSNDVHEHLQNDNAKFHRGESLATTKVIPLKKFVYQYPANQDQMHEKLSRV